MHNELYQRDKTPQMSECHERFLNFSQLLSELVDERGRKLNDTTVAFLYQLFPNDLFVKAFSLLETNLMFLYVWDSNDTIAKTSGKKHAGDGVDNSCDCISEPNQPMLQKQTHFHKHNSDKNDVSRLANLLYDDLTRTSILHRIIVQSVEGEVSKHPTYVDVATWFCSCDDYTRCFKSLVSDRDVESARLENTSCLEEMFERYSEETEDSFGKVNSHMHVNTSKVICQHLLAAAILLQTSLKVLKFFTSVKQSVSIFSVNNKDDWLKLHLNIID
ncbi:unnamed protein product [Kluyveromyces dobzhanskii CBS 2104]|uniref:WGS project CCBQ000000000 data, contig 00223 n=1 Tax=Kluyveromyces dobzhanskii CBS 2104 TaxID=1427455 RepID=A0A0A8L7N1_9SACH|nr:unnamed protein product [Kluyveromyces dobzhanskii CBS 2104]